MTDTATFQVANFDKTNLNAIRADLEAALATVATKYGIELQLGRITFDPSGATFGAKVEAAVPAVRDAKERQSFLMMASAYGLDPDKVATTKQGEVRLVGYDAKKRTKPWKLTVGGKPGYVAPDSYVKTIFAKAA